jgi:multidrug transporter EmrE-like cation transporter
MLWSLSPIFYKKAGEYYKKNEKLYAFKRLFTGFLIGMSGTFLFILATNTCKTLTKSVTYTYALPILLTTLYSKILFNEKLTTNKYIGLVAIIGGLYLLG